MKPKKKPIQTKSSRRQFLGAAAALSGLPLMPYGLDGLFKPAPTATVGTGAAQEGISIIGDYGPFVAQYRPH